MSQCNWFFFYYQNLTPSTPYWCFPIKQPIKWTNETCWTLFLFYFQTHLQPCPLVIPVANMYYNLPNGKQTELRSTTKLVRAGVIPTVINCNLHQLPMCFTATRVRLSYCHRRCWAMPLGQSLDCWKQQSSLLNPLEILLVKQWQMKPPWLMVSRWDYHRGNLTIALDSNYFSPYSGK